MRKSRKIGQILLALGFITVVSILASLVLLLKKTEILKAKEIRIGTISIPSSLDAHNTISYNDIQLIDNLFSKLFHRNSILEYKGDLAKSWRIANDRGRITIDLHNDRRFSDGTLVDAESVSSSLTRALSSESVIAFFFRNIQRVDKIDRFTVEIQFTGWEGLVFQQLSSPFLPIYKNGFPPNQTDRKTWIVKSPLQILSWRPDQMLLKYNMGDGLLRILSHEAYGNKTTKVDVLLSRENGRLDSFVQADDIKNFRRYLFDSFNTKVIFLNSALPLPTRQCLLHAVDRAKAIDHFFGLYRNHSLFPPGIIGGNRAVGLRFEDAPKVNAKKRVKLMVRAKDRSDFPLIELVKAAAQSCLVEIEVDIVASNVYYKRILDQTFDLNIATISVLYNDPNFLLSFFHPDSKFCLTGSTRQIGLYIDRLLHAPDKVGVIESTHLALDEIYRQSLVIPLANIPSQSLVRRPLTIKSEILFDIIKWEDFYAN